MVFTLEKAVSAEIAEIETLFPEKSLCMLLAREF